MKGAFANQANKRLLIISFHYYPASAVGARRVHNLMKYLPEFGVTPYLLTVRKEHYADVDAKLEEIAFSKDVCRTASIGPLKVPPKRTKETFFQRLWRQFIYAISYVVGLLLFPDPYIGWFPFAVRQGVKLHEEIGFDAILSTGNPWTDFFIGDALSRRLKIPHIMDYRDPWTMNNRLSIDPWKNKSKKCEADFLNKALLLSVNTERIKKMFFEKFPSFPKQKICVIRNGYDPEILKGLQASEKKNDSTKFTLIHTGLFYGGRTLESLLRAIHQLKEAQILTEHNFELISYGAFLTSDSKLIEQLGLGSLCTQRMFVTYIESLVRLREATMCLLVVGEAHAAMVPAKFFDYLMVARPIFCIGPEDSEVRDLMQASSGAHRYCAIHNIGRIKTDLLMAFRDFVAGNLETLEVPEAFSIKQQVKQLAYSFFLELDKEENLRKELRKVSQETIKPLKVASI